MIKNSIGIIILIFLFSCSNEKQKKELLNLPVLKEVNGNRKLLSALPEPKKINIDKSRLVKVTAGKAKTEPANLNVSLAGEPKRIILGNLFTISPGKDTVPLPQATPAIDSSFYAGLPETVIAKDMANKDRNSANFSNFSKLQGLKHGNVRSLLEDKSGNLWFGTYGGACRYDGKTFTHFTEKEGLCNNTILCMLQDKSGNLWFGTNGGGVSKYDGKRFTNYSEREGLAYNVVWSILEDKNGNIWFGTGGFGVSRYDGKTFTTFTKREGLPENTVLSIMQDSFGAIWFGTGGGVCRYDGEAFTHITEKDGLCNNYVLCIKEDRHKNIWFGTGGGVSCYDGNRVDLVEQSNALKKTDLIKENGKYVKTLRNYTTQEGLSNNVVWSVLEDQSSGIGETELWFSTGGEGLSRFNGETFTRFSDNEGLTSGVVWSSLKDRSGNLWFGTGGGGVLRYDGKTFSHLTEKEGLSSNIILAITDHKFSFEKEQSIWLGTNGAGLTRYDGKTFTHYTEKEGLINNVIRSMVSDRNSNLWIGTTGGLCYFDGISFTYFSGNSGISKEPVLSILEDRTGNMWFGTSEGGVMRYDGETFRHYTEANGFSNKMVWSILEDKKGNMWFGTDGGGLLCFDGSAFIHYTEKEGFSSKAILSSVEDDFGNVWFGTDGEGVWRYNGSTFTNYSEKHGLSNSVIMSLLKDRAGNMWFGTRFGLSKAEKAGIGSLGNDDKEAIRTEKTLFKSYDYTDGFLGIGVYGGKTMLEDQNGNIWIGANDRLSVYHPSALDDKDTVGPNIMITNVALFNENIAWNDLEKNNDAILILGNGIRVNNFRFDGVSNWYALPENLSLAYSNNYLTFSFIGITMKQAKKVKYQYKLEGNDENWSAISNRTEASYGNLAPGDYIFKVKALNSDGYWSKEFQYAFTIRPPWWQTWWFKTLFGILTVALVMFYIRWRERKLLSEKILLEETVKERTAEVVKEKSVVEKQKQLIEEKHKEITDSINYAERIQRSFLATQFHLDENLNPSLRGAPITNKSISIGEFGATKQSVDGIASPPSGVCNDDSNYFILFKPKDVVSGDFYWSATLNNGNFALATADSTGHGVPGAIMSLLNITSLEKAIETETHPDKILYTTREIIIDRLKKDGSIDGGKDGMDCSLLVFNQDKSRLTFASANNPVIIIRQEQVMEFKPDKMPVGKHDKQDVPFTLQELELQSGDVVYTLTDGFTDQFGGPAGKKFMSKKLREILKCIAHLPMQEQHLILEKTFSDWVGDLEQIDDVTLIGIRV